MKDGMITRLDAPPPNRRRKASERSDPEREPQGDLEGIPERWPLKVAAKGWEPERRRRDASRAGQSDGRQKSRHKAFFRMLKLQV